MSIKEVVIVGAVRTAIGSYGGMFKKVMANELATAAVKELLTRTGIDPVLIDDVILGNCMMRTDEINVARVVGLQAGIPVTTPAMTIQRQCASGMQAIISGTQQIQLGASDVALVGGVESMSNVPYVLKNARWGQRMGHAPLTDALTEGLTDPIHGIHMGITAENLAEKYNISREEQDELACLSHQRALDAIDAGKIKEALVPYLLKSRKGDTLLDTDEHPRRGTTVESLAKLRTVFKPDGSVTAGNASGLNDGAAVMLLMSADKAKELNIEPMARIAAYSKAGVEPELMGYGPVPAVKKLLDRTGLSLSDIQLIELNEAFAAQYIACEKGLELDRSITNVNGSGISLGHPVGATGCRITTSMLYEMRRRDVKRGLATLCVGGGMGTAILLER
jgi:acetyl-CoA C-acetyltransferase